MQIPMSKLCAQADVAWATYNDALRGKYRPTGATLGRLQTALDRLRRGVGGEAFGLAPHAVFKTCMVVAAAYMQADARSALDADPGRRATANPEWQRAAEVRRVGYFIANQFLGFRTSDLARAAGVTKQAVSSAIRELEWERDAEGGNNRQLDELLSRLEEVFS